jgi:hypothetical protein
MATGSVALESIPSDGPDRFAGEVLVWGKPATRFEILFGEVVSFLDLFRITRDEDAEPLALAFVKLAMLVLVGVAATALIGYALGVAVAHGYESFAG